MINIKIPDLCGLKPYQVFISAYGRLERAELFLAVASLMATRSKCERGKVGCVITSADHRIIATGYNGGLPDEGTCHEKGCDISQTCINAIHAERNAFDFAAKNGIELQGGLLYCTTAPCLHCARDIVQVGIKRVTFINPYKDDAGLELLKKYHIPFERNLCQL